jgi:hypothetical protein
MKNLNQDSRCPSQDSNLGPPENISQEHYCYDNLFNHNNTVTGSEQYRILMSGRRENELLHCLSVQRARNV